MVELVVTMPVMSIWPTREEVVARQAVQDALHLAQIGTCTCVGEGTGEMRLFYLVADESAAGTAMAQTIEKAVPGIRYRISSRWTFTGNLGTPPRPCPYCGTTIAQSRDDGRCVGCGKLLPEDLRASALVCVFRHPVDDLLWNYGATLGERRLRQFACLCCRRIWHLLADPRARAAVEVAERYACGEAENKELEWAFEEARAADQLACHDDALRAVAYTACFDRAPQDSGPFGYNAKYSSRAAHLSARTAVRAAGLAAGKVPSQPPNLTPAEEPGEREAQDRRLAEFLKEESTREREAQRALLTNLLADATDGDG
jgi:hypothetical protein